MGCFSMPKGPFIIKIVRSFHRSIVFFIICYAAHLCTYKTHVFLPTDIWSEQNTLIAWSPFGQMLHFSLGIMAYFAVKMDKRSHASILLILMAALPGPFCSPSLLFSILTCLFILTVKSSDILIQGARLNCLKLLSKYSFHIYLTHMLALTIGTRAASIICEPSTFYFYAVKLVITVVATILLCLFLEISQRIANWLFLQRKSNPC